jgi:hypothetical protein
MFFCGLGALAFQRASREVQLVIAGIWVLGFLGLALSVSLVEQRMSGQGAFNGQ